MPELATQPETLPLRAGDVGFILRESWRLHPRACVVSFLETVARILRYLMPTLMGALIGGLASHRLAPVLVGLIGMILSLGANGVLTTIGIHERLRLYEIVGHDFDLRTGRLMASPPTLDHFEDPTHLDRFQIFADRPGVIGMAFNMVVNSANNILGPLTGIVAAAVADWRMALVALAAAATCATSRPTMRWQQQAEEESAAPSRRSEALMALALEPTSSAELRVFGARGWHAARLRQAVRDWWAPRTRASLKSSSLDLAVGMAYFAFAGGMLLWIIVDAAAGRVSVATVTIAIASLGFLADAAEGIVWSIGALVELLRNLARYRQLEDYATSHQATGTLAPPARLTRGISLRGVDFAYPGAESLALRDLTLDLPAGAIVAVVGENGAGKSTLVKLLTGMYVPQAGEIDVDGVPLRELDLAAWRSRCAGAFQDHLHMESTALEAITVGDLGAVGDEARAREALRAAAAEDVLGALPDGLATELGPHGGVDLSGGQWQRLAIARGMMRRDPLLLVLDEPTSALDPATEHALFEGYAAAARATGGRGGVTLLVTHRFSTVASADLVVVLADGGVAEVGTHAELIAAGGRYAELYELQARGYR